MQRLEAERQAMQQACAYAEKAAADKDLSREEERKREQTLRADAESSAQAAQSDLKAQATALKAKSTALEHCQALLDKAKADSEKQRAELEETYSDLKAEHSKFADLIAALRRQIQETKDALELDDPKLEDMTAKIQAETANLQKQLQAHVKFASASPSEVEGGRVRLGTSGAPPRSVGGALPVRAAASRGKLGEPGLKFEAMDQDGDGVLSKEELQSRLRNMGWSLEEAAQTFAAMDRDGDGGISANEFAAFCQMQDKKLQAGMLSGLLHLRRHLAAMAKANEPKPVRMIMKLGLDFRCAVYRCVCFITAGPITKLCAWGEEESGGRVL
jgi:Ca2+-binding EF-hand superfamily protein